MDSVQIITVHFICGAYMKNGQSYLKRLISDLVKMKKKHQPSYIKLMIHTEVNRLYEEISHLSLLDCIHQIDTYLHRINPIYIGTTPNRIQAKQDLINMYISCDARMHCPPNCEVTSGQPLLFQPTLSKPQTQMDRFLKKLVIIPV